MSEIRPEAIEHQVRHRLAELRGLSFDALQLLPSWASEDVTIGASTIRLTTYCEQLDDGRLEVVVQGSEEDGVDRLVWRGVRAHGFWAWPDGRTETLPDAQRLYYM